MIALVGTIITEEQIYTYDNTDERDEHLIEMNKTKYVENKWNCKDGLTCSFILKNSTYLKDPNNLKSRDSKRY